MTANPENNSRLLALLRAANYVLCDGPSLPAVESTVTKNRSQLMRMPYIHCSANYLSKDTIDQLKKEIGISK